MTKKKSGEAEERIRQLLKRVIAVAEAENKRLARELHDSLGPRLAGLNLKIATLARRVTSQPELAGELQEIWSEVSDIAKFTHDLSRALHPAAIAQVGLAPALEGECVTFSALYGISVDFSAQDVPAALPEPAALCLYRITQEALQNIRLHSRAKTASVSLRGTGSELVMVIQDSGRGFDVEAARRSGGLGLISMEERVRAVNGKLTVTSTPGAGTWKEVRIPLAPA